MGISSPSIGKKGCWIQAGVLNKYKIDGSIESYKARLVAKVLLKIMAFTIERYLLL